MKGTVTFQPQDDMLFSGVLDENRWLMELYGLWNSFPINTIPLVQSTGASILRKLVQDRRTFLKRPPDEATLILIEHSENGISPSLSNIIFDLVASSNPNTYDFFNQYGDPEAKYPEIISSMFQALKGAPWNGTRRLYGALDIESTDGGLDSCRVKAHPYCSRASSLVNGRWTSTLTPPGAISHTHMDYYGSLQYFIHIEGRKLWLLWPSTPHNLTRFASHHKQRAAENRTMDCIHELEGLQLLYLEEGNTIFALKPNTLHACMSFDQCAHTAMLVWDYELFDHSFAMMEWGLTWLKSGALSDQPRVALEEELGTLQHEVSQWERLMKQNRRHTLTPSIQKRLNSLKGKMRDISV